ncbi:MAG: T9SS type A sorting domain-containing protein [Bacteroidales bacterium]|nr:T9SS type A sorting domain-containing protein [Bacteroidales bacterium]
MKKVLLLLGMLSLSFWGFAQVSKQQAINLVMDSIAKKDAVNINVYVDPLLQTDSYYKMSRYDSIQSPYANYWLFFIDDMPEYGWGHDCRYVFVDSDCGIITVASNHIPPYHFKLYMDVVSESIAFVSPPIYSDTMEQTLVNYDYPSNSGKYALLFTGGEISGDNHIAFWNVLCHSYCGLLENGFVKDNIFVLSCDGDTANISLDFDKDGLPDIMNIPCNLQNIENVMDSLSTIIQGEDVLYVYGAMHGDTIANGLTYLHLWDGERLYDFQLAEMLSRVSCSQYIVNIHSCFAGGMADEIISIPNNTRKTVLTSTGNITLFRFGRFVNYTGMDEYNYIINTALRNYHPIYPDTIWKCGYPIGQLEDSVFFLKLHADLYGDINYDSIVNGGNGNGIQEIGEVIKYTEYLEPSQFGQNGVKYYDCGFKDDLLSLRGITGKVVSVDTLSGNFHIEETLSVCAQTLRMEDFARFYLFDADLIIEDTASLIMGDTTAIIARSGNCRVIVKGSLTLGKGVTFEARDGATLEIIFENGADLAISNATFINCTLDLPIQNLSFDYCHFDGTPLEMNNTSDQSSTAIVTNCVFTPNGSNIDNAVYIKNFVHYKVSGCTIASNNDGLFKNGIAVYNSGSNSGWKQISGNDVSGCLQAGIQMYASSGSITMNAVYGNGYGIKLLNNCNIASLSGNCGATIESGTQFIHDNTNNEVYMTGNSIPQRFRYNAIHHNGNTAFVYHDAYIAFGDEGELPVRGSIDVKHNHWGSGFVPTTHLYTNLIGGAYEYNPVWVLGDCSNEWVDAAMLLNEADSLNNAGAYLEAQIVYKQVINNHPETVSAETALKSLLSLEAQLDGDYLSLKEYYLSNTTIEADETLSHLASSLANKCDELMENYEDAIAWYENVLTDPKTSFNDSIFAAIDLGELYLKMEANGEKGMCGKLKQFVPKSMQTHKTQTDYALSLLPNEKANSSGTMNVDNNIPPVSNLDSQVLDNDTVFLSWSIPSEADEVVVSWSNMIDCGDWGVAAGQCATDQAARFDVDDLVGFVGWRIKDVSVILSYSDTMSGMQDQNYYIRIWKGTNNELEQIYEKEIIQPIYSVPLTVSVDSDVFVDDKDLWIGYYIDRYRMYPWIMDDVPVAPQGKGFYYRLYHKDSNDDCIVGQNWGNDWPYSTGNLCVASTLVSPEREYGKKSLTAPLTGYRIYRNGTFIKEIPYSFVTHYTDTEFTKGIDVEYCVTAVYGNEESDPVCTTVSITSVGETEKEGSLPLSPNPTRGTIYIKGANITRIQVFNALGQLMKAFNDTNEIDLKDLPQGVYLLRITDENGTAATRKVVVE